MDGRGVLQGWSKDGKCGVIDAKVDVSSELGRGCVVAGRKVMVVGERR